MREITVDFLDDRARTSILTWNKDDIKEVEAARRRFTKYLEEGWIGFLVTPEGKKIQVHEFDPKFEKIVLARVVEGG